MDRSLPHVMLNVHDIEDTSTPWLSSARMHEDREFAVLCATCAPAAVAEDATVQVQTEAREGIEQAQAG